MEDSEDGQNIEEQNAQYLWNIGRKISSSCPAASRYYMFSLKRNLESSSSNVKGIKQQQFCEHCGNLWSSTNHKVRIQPPAKKNNHIKKLLKWETEQPWKLNNRQRKKLLKYRESCSKIIYTCLCCKKTTQQPCFKRKIHIKERMTSLYTLPSKIRPKKRDLNAGLLIHSQKKSIVQETQEKESSCKISVNCDPKVINNESPSSSSKAQKSTSSQPKVTNSLTKNLRLAQNVSSSLNLSKNNKKKKSLLAQILKQEQEVEKKKTGLCSFLISI